MSNIFLYETILCHVPSHLTSSPTQNDPAPILQPQLINLGQGDVDTEGQIRSLKLCDVPYSAGVAELWRLDSRWASLGWGPFKSNRIALVHVPAPATLSEQITCSSKGYDSPWHLCWDPAITESCGLVLNSYKRLLLYARFLAVWVRAWVPTLTLFIIRVGKSK